MKRKVYKAKIAGSFNNLNLIDEDLSEPKDDEVTVEVKSIGLNFADVFSVLGLYKAAPKTNLVPGLEYAGVILRKGKSVSNYHVGDKIYGAAKFGAYTTHLNVNQSYINVLPPDWSCEDGASFTVQALTAYYGLVILGDLKQNQTVLIHSAAGGVGIYANRIAKKFNAFTVGTVGNNSKIPVLESEGYDRVIVRSKYFISDLIKSLGNKELNIVMDSIGGRIFKTSYEILAPTGRIICFGAADMATGKKGINYLQLFYKYIKRHKIDPLKLIEQNKGVFGFNLIYLFNRSELMKIYLNDIQKLNLSKPFIGHRYDFENLKEALIFFKSGKSIGKIVVNIS